MSEDLHEIDDIFRKDIEGHREELPPAVWDAVNNHLNQQQATYYRQKYRRLKNITTWCAAACVVALLMVLTVRQVKNPGTKITQAEIIAKAPETSQAHESILADKTTGSKSQSAASQVASQPSDTMQELSSNPSSQANTQNSASTNAAQNLTTLKANKLENPSSSKLVELVKKPAIKQPTQNQVATVDAPVKQADEAVAENASLVSGIKKEKPGATKRKPRIVAPAKPAESFDNTNGDNASDLTAVKDPAKATVKQSSSTTDALWPATTGYGLPSLPTSAAYRSAATVVPYPLTSQPLLMQGSADAGKHKKQPVHLLSISAFATPNFSFSRLEDDHHFARPGRGPRDAEREEQHNVSFSAGLLLGYQLSPKWNIQTGVAVSSFSTSVDPKTIYAAHDDIGRIRYELPCSYGSAFLAPETGMPLTIGDSARTSATTSKLTYINIPLQLSYTIRTGRVTFYPTVGTAVNLLTGNKASTSISGGTGKQNLSNSITGLKSSYLSGQFGVGVEYSLSKMLSISVQPTASFAITPVNQQTPVKSYQNFFSLQTGLRVRL